MQEANHFLPHASSFRDPAGFVFEKEEVLYRQVNSIYQENYDHLMQSGCYQQLVQKGLLLPHSTVTENLTGDTNWYTTILPERVPVISYPYEWCFDMLRDAALTTLRIAAEALQYDMILKDATPFNMQWHKGKMVLIDTLSLVKYDNQPWIAYRQFCEMFLAPLLLMHYSRQQLTGLLLAWPAGIPVETASALLPRRSRFSLHTYLHIHLQARYSKRRKGNAENTTGFTKQKLRNLLGSLELLINRLRTPQQSSTWSAYYEEATQRGNYLEHKKQLISSWVDGLPAIKTATDLGANDGLFARLLTQKSIEVLAADIDPYCINRLYLQRRQERASGILPLVQDLAFPTPAIGQNNEERSSFTARAGADLVMGLALIHHLAIGKQLRFDQVAAFMSKLSSYLILEFVPAEDEKTQQILKQQTRFFPEYTINNFESAFSKHFDILKKDVIQDSVRTLYLFRKKTAAS
ncbi:MAG: hypothetical protein KA821_17185 [Chitinophagaceae bacterium]|nr:hypothetical protein [Chitinophagaceae bacterium]